MLWLSSAKCDDRYGILIDIGSGSVLAAIVHSCHGQALPDIVWAHREYVPLKNIDVLEQSAKAVMSAFVDVAMLLDTEGRKVLRNYDRHATITELQCAVCAPWSYTVTKTVNYEQDKPFKVRETLIDDLEEAVEQQIIEELRKNHVLEELGLVVMSQITTGITANGYAVVDPVGEMATTLRLSRTSAVSQSYLLDAILEMRDKLFPRVGAVNTSFLMLLFSVLRQYDASLCNACLINATNEATELGVVRDTMFRYATHTPYGSYSLAREIAAVTKVPLAEAFSYLNEETPLAFIRQFKPPQQAELEKIFDAFAHRLADLFAETGDGFLIPSRIYLHAGAGSQSVYLELIKRAAKLASVQEPEVSTAIDQVVPTPTSSAPLPRDQESGLLLSALFFHNHSCRTRFVFN